MADVGDSEKVEIKPARIDKKTGKKVPAEIKSILDLLEEHGSRADIEDLVGLCC